MTSGSPRIGKLPFAEVTALSATGPGRFDAVVDPGWTVTGKPNGGYLLAMLGRAAATVSAHAHVIAASAHFLRAPTPGPVVIEAEPLRDGRSASQVRARMRQDGQACIEALLTTSAAGSRCPTTSPSIQSRCCSPSTRFRPRRLTSRTRDGCPRSS